MGATTQLSKALWKMIPKSEQLTVFGPWLGPDQENIESVLSVFAEQSGHDVRYVGSDSFESWVDLGTYADEGGSDNLYGFFYKVDVKSLVWYSPENFEDAGYEIPTTMEDLKALSDQIVADGGTPWCIGLGSGGATGWPAARNDAYVAGGAGAVASTDFRDSPKGIFSSPPQCYMHRQASFIPAFFPEGTSVGEDADFFYFPAYAGKDLGSPVLGAGTLFAITNENDAAHELIDFLKTAEAHELFMARGWSGFFLDWHG